jgi:hypothetical protein
VRVQPYVAALPARLLSTQCRLSPNRASLVWVHARVGYHLCTKQ